MHIQLCVSMTDIVSYGSKLEKFVVDLFGVLFL